MENKRQALRNRDPFAVDPLPKAHYYPSPERFLNKTEKATAIKTNYNADIGNEVQIKENAQLNPLDEMFLKGSNMYQTKPTGLDDAEPEVNFDETWPSSERPSSLSFTGLEDESPLNLNKYLSYVDMYKELNHDREYEEGHRNGFERRRMPGSTTQGTGLAVSSNTGKPSKSKIPVKNSRPGKELPQDTKLTNTENEDGTILQRYVDRFRNSQPTSREEREQSSQSASQDFWWLSNGPPPERNRDTQGREAQGGSTVHTTPLTTVNLDKYKHLQQLADKQRSRAFIPESPGDKRTIELQERAEKLLERSSSTVLSTEPAVSTEGLGSNTSDMSSLEEYSYRPKFANYLDSDLEARYRKLSQPPLLGQEQQGARYQSKAPPPMPGQRPPAEDDPLHQWRLRRRIELAQQSSPQHTQQFDFISKTDQQKKIDQRLEEFKHRLSGRAPARQQVQFTPAPQQSQERQQHTSSKQTCQNVPHTGDLGFHEPQIASPSLHPPKPKSEHVEEIDPHMHLMCDLLPCPHRGRLQPENEHGTKSDHKTKLSHNIQEKDIQGSSKDKSRDKLGEYKQYLEAEKPDVENAKQEKDKNDVERGRNEESEKRSIHDIEEMVKDIGRGDDDIEDVRSEKKEKGFGKLDKKLQKVGRKESDHSGTESEHLETKAKHLDKEGSVDERLEESEENRDRVIKPRHSSSPKRGKKGVSAAIGQVIKEHLFSTSTSTVLSSVDSLPPSASTDRLPWKQKPRSHDPSHDQQVKQLEENDAPCDSDDEFSDDNLLHMLRKQRAMYEQQLQEIDSMLNKMESR